ncbi:hypothetical protein FA95DRAFT_1607185 [Auriscalpium vulgare]|uniref:Uncharacterized protein n=1 Tax=Auriscalpium vulgare TaxID=40419 RepID=A0ACB8RQ02_9AGAM|nr:hypothetical protein FA95DRAFT_1607185 [Auriscalpium vulgare]
MFASPIATLASLAYATGVLASSQAPPSVQLDRATFISNASGVVAQFLGIPFTLPPVGNLRLRLSLPNAPYTGVHNASAFGPACDCDDEGTFFSISTTNLTTDEDVRTYLATNYLKGAPSADIDTAPDLFKRLAALIGDLAFQSPRRLLLQQRAGKQPVFSYSTKRLKTLPDLRAFHSSDVAMIFGPSDMTDYLIRFAAHLDPNFLTFLDGTVPMSISLDTFRLEGIEALTKVALAHPW